MDDVITKKLLDVLVPIIIIPLPFVGKYEKKININDGNFIKQIFIGDDVVGSLYTILNCNLTDINNFILKNILKIQESIILYNDIYKDCNNTVYNLRIFVCNGNRKVKINFATNDKNKFLKLISNYSKISKRNNIDGISKIAKEISNDLNRTYKIKTKRKSLL